MKNGMYSALLQAAQCIGSLAELCSLNGIY